MHEFDQFVQIDQIHTNIKMHNCASFLLLKVKVIKDDQAPGLNIALGLNFNRRGPGVSGPRPIPTGYMTSQFSLLLKVNVHGIQILNHFICQH